MEENNMSPLRTLHFLTGKKEIGLLITIAVIAILLADFTVFGGLNLGFALMSTGCILASVIYLLRKGCKLTVYSTLLLVLALVITASFIRSDDGFVKFVMLCFVLICVNLSLTLIAQQNRRSPNGFTSLLDAPMALFALGVGELPNSIGGLNDARKNAGDAGKKSVAVLTGLAVAVPLLAVLIPLLTSADAAFEGLLNLLPRIDMAEPVIAIILGFPLACVLYTRNVALTHRKKAPDSTWRPKTISPLTMNTVLIVVCVLYLVYLASQLAYFAGGFSGILPTGFTVAEYARRGFFEMGWLSGINLGIVVLAAALTERKNEKLSLTTRILCLFIGLISLFFTATASAKMLLYIDSYGLTRLRLLTQVIMIFLALTVIYVCVWIFRPRFAYMKAVLLTALIIGACVSWADVDTVVAAYNVSAYQSGKLETVDISHLGSLGDGAVPYLQDLANEQDMTIRESARAALLGKVPREDRDIRAWNIATALAEDILEQYHIEAEPPGA